MVWTDYGAPSGLQPRAVPTPVPVKAQLLIRIRATSVTAGDAELRALRFGLGMRLLVRLIMGPVRPRHKILGQEFAGDVERIGPDVQLFRIGDPVYGTTGFGFGAYAEYLCVRESSRDGAVAAKPVRLTYEEAATIPTGGLEALHFLRRAGDLRNKKVLIIGAGGGIGTIAVQLAKSFGANVTAVDGPRKMDLLRGIGADRVIDYSREEYARRPDAYDVILDVVGRSPFSASMEALRDGGVYLVANPRLSVLVRALWARRRRGKKVFVRGSPPSTQDLDDLRELIQAGKIRPVIDRTYLLEQLPEAHRRVDSGLAIGRVAITV
ncbi:MAG TPA: NAD(P)-dependent alcohol dehydrogenase [Thermoplasmata archaeon]|nr:NAD(P)-dependent alcohol dehydrogenase [Thermoplasmata archaeon]